MGYSELQLHGYTLYMCSVTILGIYVLQISPLSGYSLLGPYFNIDNLLCSSHGAMFNVILIAIVVIVYS
jgi:hypothetical protein